VEGFQRFLLNNIRSSLGLRDSARKYTFSEQNAGQMELNRIIQKKDRTISQVLYAVLNVVPRAITITGVQTFAAADASAKHLGMTSIMMDGSR
jgi:hypothetical protein